MRRNRRALSALVLVVVLAACGSDDQQPAATGDATTTSSTAPPTSSTTTEPAEACSAAALSNTATDDQAELPPAVAETRAAIIEAAVACDLDRLEELSVEGDGQFSYSFGATSPEGLADHLREREAEGEEIVRILVETLRLPYVSEAGTVAWPSAHQQSPSESDWDALRTLYRDEEVDAWRSGGSGFLGYRVGITEAGDWQFFIAGD